MKTTFEYDYEAAVALACKYSDHPETLKALIARLQIEIGPQTVIPSPWCKDSARPLNALHMLVTINAFTFPYYGSHSAAEAFTAASVFHDRQSREKALAARSKFKIGLLHFLLCSIRCDYRADESPEEIGLNPDSIKDMANFNEIREHVRKLRAALRLTSKELESLPS
jgi:hypothetical protein